jgi:RimJ/RimL family protein N-acetyltransferase
VIEPVTLENAHVRLEPLSERHIPQLLEIAGRAPEVYTLTTVPPTLEGMTGYVNTALEWMAQGKALPFATCAPDGAALAGTVLGSTRLANLEYWAWPAGHPLVRTDGTPDAAEIGWTWLAPQAQRTRVNTAAKLLMLTHAFETWRVQRVTLKTDARNERSRNAILRLGAQFEGILRAHVPAADGMTGRAVRDGIRDSAMYSIVATEWEAVKAGLEEKLARVD